MKCSVCSKEFGTGTHCQHCGVDRVTGLANYSGFDNHSRSANHHYTDNAGQSSNNITACYSCGEIIPSDAEYCPYCRKKLYEECPKCGKTYSSQFDNCPKCGTNRVQYYNKLKAEEEERTIRNEAAQIRESFSSSALYVFIFIVFEGVLLSIFIYFLEYMTTIWSWIIVILVSAWGCPFLSDVICEKVKDEKIEKWKQENPSDPRCKYL